MKLKNKLIIIVCIAATVSIIVSGIVLLWMLRSSMIRDAYGEAMMVSTEAFSRFESLVDRNDAEGLDARIKVVYSGKSFLLFSVSKLFIKSRRLLQFHSE